MKCKKYTYSIEQNMITIEKFIKRYHFNTEDRDLLSATGKFLAELNQVEAGIAYCDDKVVCVATLGERYDRLFDVVADSKHLLLAYSMECFAMEFLSRTYEKMNETVYEETGKWMGEYHFLGDDELEDIETYLKEFSSAFSCDKTSKDSDDDSFNITWKNGMINPLKSVIFTAGYSEKRSESGCHNCEQCSNLTCSFRNIVQRKERKQNDYSINEKNAAYSYGIAQIFGKHSD